MKLLFFLIGVLSAVVTAACALGPVPASYDDINASKGMAVHDRKITTPAYTGSKGAVIFTLNHVEDCSMTGATDIILRLFAESGIPVDVAVQPDSLVKRQDLLAFLREYVDAGIIDISVGGSDVNWVDSDSPNLQGAINELRERLSAGRDGFSRYFGMKVATCVFPYESLNEHNYNCLINSGFIAMSTRITEGFSPSREPVNWGMKPDSSGLMRMPIVGTADYRAVSNGQEVNSGLSAAVIKSLERPGIAVIEIDPAFFMTAGSQVDIQKVHQLGSLIESVKNLGEIVTFDGWNRYALEYIKVAPLKRVIPAFNGGSAVIFRLDDVCKGWHEDADMEIINVFKNNGVPVDCGVISNANNSDSFDLPWLKEYLAEGWVGISVHGYDWDYYQLDTTKSNLSYEYISEKLVNARDCYLKYFGVSPVAVTVPTDFYDEAGYRAIANAGYKVFSTQMLIEPHPSNQPVDYYGRPDKDGLYRIPTAADVCEWDADNQVFTDVIDAARLPCVKDGCNDYSTSTKQSPDRVFICSVCTAMNNINTVAIGIHPSAFVDEGGKPNATKIQKLDAIVKWAKNFATVTTFEQWYNYTSSRNLP